MTYVVVPLILVFFVAAVSSYVSRYALAWIADRLVMDLRVGMFDRLLQLSCVDLDRYTAGSLISQIYLRCDSIEGSGDQCHHHFEQGHPQHYRAGGLDGLY